MWSRSSLITSTNNVHRLLHKDLADDLEDFVLLESLSENVKRKVFGVDDTLDEIEMRSPQSSMMDVEFDVVALLLRLEEIERSTRWITSPDGFHLVESQKTYSRYFRVADNG